MSKRAEEAALKEFPMHKGASEEWKTAHLLGVCSDYIRGYNQAERDTIARACIWLRERVKEYDIIDESDVELFRKAMEDV